MNRTKIFILDFNVKETKISPKRLDSLDAQIREGRIKQPVAFMNDYLIWHILMWALREY